MPIMDGRTPFYTYLVLENTLLTSEHSMPLSANIDAQQCPVSLVATSPCQMAHSPAVSGFLLYLGKYSSCQMPAGRVWMDHRCSLLSVLPELGRLTRLISPVPPSSRLAWARLTVSLQCDWLKSAFCVLQNFARPDHQLSRLHPSALQS